MDERYTIGFDAFAPAGQVPAWKTGGADISIIVDYDPWFIPLQRRKEFRFEAFPTGDGLYQWRSRPVEQ
jgi:hypothetical protein